MRSTYLALVAAALLPACQCGETPPADTKKDAGKVIPPDAGDEIVLGRDTGACADQDEDGYGPGCPLGTDCDDQDREVHGGATEACGNGKDDDCDGETDEADCGCAWGSTRECFSGGASKAGVGICRRGLQRCDDNRWGSCVGQVLPGTEECDGLDNDCNGSTDEGKRNACGTCGDVPQEICGDGIDNDCNDQMDDGCGTCDPGCQCTAGAACVCHPPINQPCFSGSPQSAGVGECRSGLHDCVQQGAQYVWNLCRGEVLPLAEACADHLDNDCDGSADEDCACSGASQ
ncbi:MAG: putative metal-binding motif-containing protein, partial [Deltaproteobacteria bacterium]|nr:putative metal-binding motif-containing protein [Deltaproteobacteria bacterium]